MYCLTKDSGAPPTLATKYELLQRVGIWVAAARELLTQHSRRPSLHLPHQPVDSVLRIHRYKQVHVIGHHLHLKQLRLALPAHFQHDLLEATVDPVPQHVSAVLRTPHDVVPAQERNVPIAPGSMQFWHHAEWN